MQGQRIRGPGIQGENIMRISLMVGRVYLETVVYQGLLVEVLVSSWS